jgi:hypothetical protein
VMNSEHGKNGNGHRGLDWISPQKSKTLRPVWWDLREKISPLKWSPRPPYMDIGLGFLFEVGGPISGSVIKWEGHLPGLQEVSRDLQTYGRR